MADTKDLIRRLAFALEVCLPYLDREAEKERCAEEGKSLRQITKQDRAKWARRNVAEAYRYLGMPYTDV
jgi:hypothetical protein